MNTREFAHSKLICLLWFVAHLCKKLLVIFFFVLFVPLVLMSTIFDVMAGAFKLLHDLLENLFSIAYDFNLPFMLKFFKLFGFGEGDICLGTTFSRGSIIKLRQVAEENDIKCHIIQEMRCTETGSYYVKVITSKKTDLNLLKLIFNETTKK